MRRAEDTQARRGAVRWLAALLIATMLGPGVEAQTPGSIQLVAGGGELGDGRPATRAHLVHPQHLTVDRAGALYFVHGFDPDTSPPGDLLVARIKRVDPDGLLHTVVGNGTYTGALQLPATIPLPPGAPALDFPLDWKTEIDSFAGPAVGPDGTLYFSIGADDPTRSLFTVDPVGTIARVPPIAFPPGTGAIADLDTDAAGTLYVLTISPPGGYGYAEIFKIAPGTPPVLLAGSATGVCLPVPTQPCGEGLPATRAGLLTRRMRVSPQGTVYFIDLNDDIDPRYNPGPSARNYIRMIDADGRLRTVAGLGSDPSHDDIPARQAWVAAQDLAITPQGEVFFAEADRVRRIDARRRIHTISAESGALAADGAGHLYIAQGNRIDRLDATGGVTLLAGGGDGGDPLAGDGGPAPGVRLAPVSIAVDARGNTYVAEGSWIRKIDPAGRISTVAGRSMPLLGPEGPLLFSGDEGPAVAAQLNQPHAVAVDARGTVYVADTANHRIREVTPNGLIHTIAGTGMPGFSGDGGPAFRAALNGPQGIALDAAGNLYIADTGNLRVRRMSPDGTIMTVAGTGRTASSPGGGDPSGVASGLVGVASGDGGPAVQAGLARPTAVVVDGAGNVYIADTDVITATQQCFIMKGCLPYQYSAAGSQALRRIDRQGIITTVAGGPLPSEPPGADPPVLPQGDGGPALEAFLGHELSGLAVGGDGSLYVSASGTGVVWQVTADGVAHRIAGQGPTGFPWEDALEGALSGDGGAAREARLNRPAGIALDPHGDLLIADTGNRRLREVWGIGGPGSVPLTAIRLPIPGDVTEDDRVDLRDVVRVLRAAIEGIPLSASQEDAADVNGDGRVDLKDTIEILDRVVGLRTDFGTG